MFAPYMWAAKRGKRAAEEAKRYDVKCVRKLIIGFADSTSHSCIYETVSVKLVQKCTGW